MTKPSLERITITIPAPVLAAADELATRLDRSRSWVLVEAVRRMVAAEPATASPPPPEADGQLRPRLRRALALSPVERVRAAEEGARVAQGTRAGGPSLQIRGFPSLEEYQQWRSSARARA